MDECGGVTSTIMGAQRLLNRVPYLNSAGAQHEQKPGQQESGQEGTGQDREGKKGGQEGQERGKETAVRGLSLFLCARKSWQ